MKRCLLWLLTAACVQAAYSQPPRRIDWNADLDHLAAELPARHCNFFTVHDWEYLSAGIEAIKARSRELTDFQIAVKTQQLLAKFGDSHTRIRFESLMDHDRLFPLSLLWTDDGLYVLQTGAEYPELLGQRITAVNGIPLATVTDSLSTLITVDNRACVKSVVPELFPSEQILEYFGFSRAGQVELTYGEHKTCIIRATHPKKAKWIRFEPDSVCFALKNRRLLFTDRYFPEEKSTTCSTTAATAGSWRRSKATLGRRNCPRSKSSKSGRSARWKRSRSTRSCLTCGTTAAETRRRERPSSKSWPLF